MALILLGLGLVFAIEGLIFALMPGRLEEIVRVISDMPRETRRAIGLIALGLGVVLVWISRLLA